MTEVEFHFNAPDKLAYACRFVRKALRHEARVAVAAAPGQLQQLDRMLWELGATDFVAHCLDTASDELRRASPVLLTVRPADSVHKEILLNLGDAIPEGFDRFARLVEVVSLAEPDRQLARTRWRGYAAQGYAIARRDLVLKEGV
jgi:DNA polymerase-3 subunit chi